jgi:hypothetical protein
MEAASSLVMGESETHFREIVKRLLKNQAIKLDYRPRDNPRSRKTNPLDGDRGERLRKTYYFSQRIMPLTPQMLLWKWKGML